MFNNIKKACQKDCSSDCETTQVDPCIDCRRSRIWKEKDFEMMEVIQLVTSRGSEDMISTKFDQ